MEDLRVRSQPKMKMIRETCIKKYGEASSGVNAHPIHKFGGSDVGTQEVGTSMYADDVLLAEDSLD